jgi:hypothetical protein
MALDDIMLYDLNKKMWTAVCQMGCRPEGRWNAAISYCQENEILYVFGGSSYNGTCRSDVYFATFKNSEIEQNKIEYKAAINEVKRSIRTRN